VENWLAAAKIRWWLFIVERTRKRGRYAEAFEALRKVIATQPNRALAYLQAGNCLTRLGRYEEAPNFYERALQIIPLYGDAHAQLSYAYYRLGRYREAFDSLNRAVRIKPRLKDDPYWLYLLELTSAKVERWEQSLTAFRKLTEFDGKHGDAWHGVGWASAALNQESETVSAYERAVALAPENAAAHYELGLLYASLERQSEALEQFRKSFEAAGNVVRVKPNSSGAYHNLGDALQGLGRSPEAILAYEKLIGFAPQDFVGHAKLGWCY
jgi:tetratricopeptide (TPR) repeat protein